MLSLWNRSLCRGIAAFALTLGLFAPNNSRADDEPLELVPDEADIVTVIQVAKILKGPAWEQVAAVIPEAKAKLNEPFSEKTKLTLSDIQKVFIAACIAKEEGVVVMTMNRNVKESDVATDDEVKVETIGDYELFIPAENKAYCLVDDKTVAFGPAKTLRAVLKRDAEAELSEDLEAAWEEADDTKDIYVAIALETLMKQAAEKLPPGFPMTPDTLAKLNAAVLTADAKSKLAATLDIACEDEATAQQVKGLVEFIKLIPNSKPDLPPGIKDTIGTLKSTVEGDTITVTADVDVKTVLGLFMLEHNVEKKATIEAVPSVSPPKP